MILVAFVVFGFCVNAAVRMPCHDVCGSDIGRLYADRGIDRAHPPYVSRDFEYPPLIGVVMYAAVVPFAHGLRNPFLLNMLVLTALAAVTTWVLWRRAGSRAWRWALAPPLLVEGLTNWDLLSVATATIGLVAWESGYAFGSGLLLGVGTAAKLYPALFVPILAAGCVGKRQWARVGRLLGGAAVGLGVFAVPVYARAPAALGYLLRFHGDRGPDRGSITYFLFRGPSMQPWLGTETIVHIVTVGPAIVMAIAMVVLVVATARGRLSPVAACALATIVCLLASKIYSPQYDLWIVPFFVLLPVPRKLVVHFAVASFSVFVLTASDDHFLHRPASGYLLALAVVYRFAVLTLVAIDLVRSPAEPHPPPGGGEPDAVIDLTDDGPDSGEPAQHFGAVVT